MSDFPTITFTKQAGAITTTVRDALAVLPDGEYALTIDKATRKRSIEQNALYWKVLQITAEWSKDYTPEDLHELFKQEFIPQKVVRSKIDKRRKRKIPKSTTQLSTVEFTEYIKKVQALGVTMWAIDWSKYLL